MKYDFGEKKKEKNKSGVEVEVWVLPKYEQSRKKAIEIIEQYDDIDESDFWILKNETKSGTIMYSGLIISHNGCLKINDTLEDSQKFNPRYLTRDKEGYGGSLVYEYCNPEQMIYEVGEASAKNCKNPYPYAMAFKRCFDRVVLKASKLAFSGIYSESESDDFKRQENPANRKSDTPDVKELAPDLTNTINETQRQTLLGMMREADVIIDDILAHFKVKAITELTQEQYGVALNKLKVTKEKKK